MLTAITALFLVIGFIFFHNYCKQWIRLLWLSLQFDAPPDAWPVFNALVFVGKEPTEFLKILLNIFDKTNETTRFWFLTHFYVFLKSIKGIEIVLSHPKIVEKSETYDILLPWLREGLLTSSGSKWHKRRKVLTPAFHFKRLEAIAANFNGQTDLLIEQLRKCDCDDEIELYKYITLTALDIICVTIEMSSINILVLFFIGILYFIYKKFGRTYILSKGFDGPPAVPLVGNGLLFLAKDPVTYIPTIDKLFKQFGDTVKIWLGIEFNIITGNPKITETIMSSNKLIEKADHYEMLRPWLNEGLLISNGKKWFQRRKIITPAFHFKILEQFVGVFDSQSNILVHNLSKEINRKVELYPFITLCALDVICESAMGVSVNAQRDSNSEYVRAVKTISTVLHKRMFDILYRYNFLFRLTPLAREQDKALDVMHKFSQKVITSRRAELIKEKDNKHTEEDNHNNDVGVKRKMAFLDILLQSEIDGKPLSDLDIREEVDTFMFEGHDTTTSAITFCLYNLGINLNAQQKCFEEILSIFGNDKSKPATYEDLSSMHYMELCIKETLRLFPSVPIIGRKIKEECTINGKIFPAGTNIAICPLALGRDETIFPDANDFIPERFDVVTSAEKQNPYAFIPFSAGPRNCIGQKFAMLEAKSVVSKILRHYQVEFIDEGEPQLIAELILKTKNALKFKLKPRIY